MMLSSIIWLSLVCIAVGLPAQNIGRWKRDAETEGEGDKPIVFLTVSSLASRSEFEDRILELNWDRLPADVPDDARVNLYDADPLERPAAPLASVRPRPSGHYRSSVRYPEQNLTRDKLSDACLGYWIAYEQGGQVLSSNCLRARPRWMQEARQAIGNLSLLDLMIPGTHNSGSYAPFDRSDDNIFNKYLLTQEESVWNQLVYGIRYLDLRVAYQPYSQDKFMITHGQFVSSLSVRDVLQQVREFLDATDEIVILDFHRFVNGFKGRRAASRHRDLVKLLQDELGDHMIPVSFTSWASLDTLWDSGKRLYVGYADDAARRQNNLLFPAIKQLWGDVDTVWDLRRYLNRTVCKPVSRRLTSAMAQLTPTAAGVIFNSYGGLRTMADDVNRELTRWFRDEWNRCANIVASDFFLGNNIVEVAIETNKRRAQYGQT